MTVQILLATFNSEKYLAQQLDSILCQDYQDIQILLRDAGSTDRTLEIISSYEKKYPGKVILKEVGRADACRNFSRLLEIAEADVFMFSDHDDVWMSDKVSKTLKKYEEAAKTYGSTTPILVFTDSQVVNENLELISPSCFAYQKLDVKNITFPRLTVQNCASGNTMLFNRALKEKISAIPSCAVMHDHYLMLAASAFGRIILLDEPTLLYRQHTKNVLGAANYGVFYFFSLALQGRKQIRERFYCNIRQAAEFYRLYRDEIPQELQNFLSQLTDFPSLGFLTKRRFLLRHRMFKSGILRNIGMFLLI